MRSASATSRACSACSPQRRREGLQRADRGLHRRHREERRREARAASADRAELSWDENGIRYRVVLRKEDDEWRVDDIYIRPKPKDDESEKGGGVEGTIPDDF